MLVDPISLSGRCSVIAPRLPPPCRCRTCSNRRGLPTAFVPLPGRSTTALRCCSEFLYWIKAARLRRPARAGGWGPPPLPVSATAAPAPGRSARTTDEADGRARKCSRRPSTRTTARSRPSPSKHDPAVRMAAVSKPRSVADAGTGLLETYVTGARSARAPPWLTFGGTGQNRATNDLPPTSLLSNSTTAEGGCSRTRIRARRPPRYHRHRGPDQGFRDRTTRNAVEAEGWSGLLLLSSAYARRETGWGSEVRSRPCPPRRWWADPPGHG